MAALKKEQPHAVQASAAPSEPIAKQHAAPEQVSTQAWLPCMPPVPCPFGWQALTRQSVALLQGPKEAEQLQEEVERLSIALAAAQAAALEAEHARDRLEAEKESRGLKVCCYARFLFARTVDCTAAVCCVCSGGRQSARGATLQV